MKHRVRVIARISLTILLLGVSMPCKPATGQDIVVSPVGEINTLREAIERAQPGQRIQLQPGIYEEHEIFVDKKVQIEGEEGAVIDGGGRPILVITADSVSVSGLIFRNVQTSFVDDRAGVRVDEAHYCRLERNRFEDTFFAIYLAKSSYCVIEKNTIIGGNVSESHSGNGIHLWYSRYTTIRDNEINGHRDGIYLEFVEDSELSGNVSTHNKRYGLHFMFSDRCVYRDNLILENDAGVAVMYTKNVEMTGNRFEGNWGTAAYGLLLKDITDSRIAGNTFRANTVGIHADGSNRLEVVGNDFVGNGWALKVMANSVDNRFLENDFIANTFDVATNSRQVYSSFDGNYWDKYEGYDLDGNGVGDVPFRPVRLFSLIIERNEPAIILLNSFFVDLLDAAERFLPVLIPDALVDENPSMNIHS